MVISGQLPRAIPACSIGGIRSEERLQGIAPRRAFNAATIIARPSGLGPSFFFIDLSAGVLVGPF